MRSRHRKRSVQPTATEPLCCQFKRGVAFSQVVDYSLFKLIGPSLNFDTDVLERVLRLILVLLRPWLYITDLVIFLVSISLMISSKEWNILGQFYCRDYVDSLDDLLQTFSFRILLQVRQCFQIVLVLRDAILSRLHMQESR